MRLFFSDSDCESVEPQTFSLSRKRETRVALECETAMHFEGPLVKAVPESVRISPTPQSAPVKAAPESLRSRTPPPPEGTPLQQTTPWPGPPVDPPEVNDINVDEQGREAAPESRRRATRLAQGLAKEIDGARLLLEFDAYHPSRARVIVKRMITYLARERQNEELETYFSSLTDAEGVIGVSARSVCV